MEQEIVVGDGVKPNQTAVGKGGEAWGLDSVQKAQAFQPRAQWAVRRRWFIFALVPLPLASLKKIKLLEQRHIYYLNDAYQDLSAMLYVCKS